MVLFKPPGSINGQGFTIDNCQSCDIYVLDRSSQVTIDDCKDCRIYLGPVDGSVFIRDSNGCVLATACRQLRTRGCHDCSVALYCRTRPIVEASYNMSFGCFDMPYTAMEGHLRAAKLSPLHNYWWHIYDFTPKDGNWRLLPAGTTTLSLVQPLPQEVAPSFAPQPAEAPAQEAEQAPAALPSTLLLTRAESPEAAGGRYVFALFEGARREAALGLAKQLSDKGWLLFTNEAKLSPDTAESLAGEARWAKGVASQLSPPQPKAKKGQPQQAPPPCVGLEAAVPEAQAGEVGELLRGAGAHVTAQTAAGNTFRTMGVDG
ncbi:hypothetical protein HYH03_017638 [Edaphochlamys debaryana]|uniref:C-CAP/cofactor C-like domain-containing protein n=1 Tax=Edaphochlamys debaryana TaxID=47281 RepID=A0A835XIQ9_9CHLO|nr:hypothetical protein HYH03_017638 [Edaphochlamys debaryana]|eukprot:KAG2483533.1 hypothetical protein HYH03_017638 [Edaphochlamys debaryana]